MDKVIIVEGRTDRERLLQVLDEPVEIVCTQGTISSEDLHHLVADYEDAEIYVLADADDAGNKLRRQIKQEFPNAHHLYTRKVYREVAATPLAHLAEVLANAHFNVKSAAVGGNAP